LVSSSRTCSTTLRVPAPVGCANSSGRRSSVELPGDRGLPPAAYGRAPELTFVRFRSHLHPWRSRPGAKYVVRIRVSRAREYQKWV